jgi:hypothetical protein
MSENSESAKLVIHASSPNCPVVAFAKVDRYQQLKETVNSQLWSSTTSPNGWK